MKSPRTMFLVLILILPQLALAQRRHVVQPSPGWTFSPEAKLRGPDGYDYSPSVAFSGQAGIAAWIDRTSAGSGSAALRYSILGAGGIPVSSDGMLLDAPVFDPVTVAATGSEFLVAWVHGGRLLATRIGLDGHILDATPIVVATNAGESFLGFADGPTRMTCSDHDCLVTWMASGVAHGVLVSAGGVLLTPEPLTLSGASLGYGVAWGKDHYLVLSDSGWSGPTGSTLYATTVSAGNVSQPSPLTRSTSTTIINPTAAWSGDEWIVTWTDFRGLGLASPSFDDIRFARLDGTEHWLDTSSSGTLIGTIRNPGWVDWPVFTLSQVVWDGKNYAVLWGTNLSRVTPVGHLLDGSLVFQFLPEGVASLGGGKILLASSGWTGQTSEAIVRALAE